MTTPREVRLELILGRKVRDPSGAVVGRLEEVVVEDGGGRQLITEFHVGKYAALERFLGGTLGRSLLRFGGRRARRGFIVPWEMMDLRDPRDLRITLRASALREMSDGHGVAANLGS
jgi:sporulation protein YlmC with PRC-barrel domain